MVEASLLWERGVVYKALSLSFYTPSDADAQRELSEYLTLLLDVRALPIDRDTIRFFAESWRRAWTLPRDELLREYTRLFVNDYPELKCPPFETYWRDGKRTIYGSGYSSLLEIYRQASLESSPEVRLPLEHVALELELMYYLVVSSADNAGFLCLQEKLFKNHIGRWAEPYAQCLESSASLDNYRASAKLLRELYRVERGLFDSTSFCV
ncbi:molecular chaperone TorD family protein [Infirmifilum lucidum]|uniref:Molecular chaperone TorD family protein n=1 Tax=Infirmifilum lucidum TaxID=2776706 RepID=A0A7L9FGD7_9CREN|nr:molecular chaperone TorD family protein [Infirmifilum lucidum]QOJ78860.1 molecular chaperone TorD family protein [Infirmifilum lucidum]